MTLNIDSLNPQQREAVVKDKGRLLILAGAGSGKTRVLTTRIAYLILKCQVNPSNILGLTFTNKAAEEMRHRLSKIVHPKSARAVTLCTFHSLCMHILRQDIHHLGFTSNFTLYDETEVQRLIATLVRDIMGINGNLPSLAPTLAAISNARNKGIPTNEIKNTGSDWHDELSREVYDKLQISFRACNALDFDQLLLLTVDLFEKHPHVLEKYQEQYQYILIDEYQDTNPIQYRLASLLSAKHRNLCVVGDDDQSIYGWRGADVNAILSFEDAATITLQQNYRSTNNILNAANHVISQNTKRHQKSLWSDKGEGELIEVFHAPNATDEADAVACRINLMRKHRNLKWNDIAILYRSNALARPLETALMKQTWYDEQGQWVRGIPYEIIGGTEFYQRREIKDVLCYLRTLVNPKDQEALLRIINIPRRGLGDVTLDMLTTYNRKQKTSLWDVLSRIEEIPEIASAITSKSKESIKNFFKVLSEAKSQFTKGSLAEATQWLIDAVDYKRAIYEEVKSMQMREFKWNNVQELVQSMQEFDSPKDGLEKLTHFLSTLHLDDNWNKSNQNKHVETVKLMTIHSAKGLEFPACFIVGLEDHIIPHEKSLLETGVEEERRLMYVAITRAMKHLTLSMARERPRFGKNEPSKPSRFLFDIPKELLKMTDWQNPQI